MPRAAGTRRSAGQPPLELHRLAREAPIGDDKGEPFLRGNSSADPPPRRPGANVCVHLDNHVCVVHRMLGSKAGTGGSSGYQYLRSTVR